MALQPAPSPLIDVSTMQENFERNAQFCKMKLTVSWIYIYDIVLFHFVYTHTNNYTSFLFAVAVLSPSLVASGCLMVDLPTDGSLHLFSAQRLAEQVEIFSLSDFMSNLGLLLEGEKAMREQTFDPDFILEVTAALDKLRTASVEAERVDKSLIPLGAVIVKRTFRSSQLPPSMTLIEESRLPFKLRSKSPLLLTPILT